MDFFEVAKQMESDAVKFYNDLAAKTPIPQLKGVFAFMAQEEQKHHDLFAALQHKTHAAPIVESGILTLAKEAFAKAREGFQVPSTLNDSASAYVNALEGEKHAVAFYSAESAKVTDSRQKGDLALIIDQEKQHVRLLEGLVDFVRRPAQWIEDAEFNHLDKY